MFLSGEFCSQNQKIFYYYDLSFYFYFFKASRSKGLATEVKELLVPKELENVLLHFFSRWSVILPVLAIHIYCYVSSTLVLQVSTN